MIQQILDTVFVAGDSRLERDLRILKGVHGIDCAPMTLRKLAAKEGLSAERVRQLVKRAHAILSPIIKSSRALTEVIDALSMFLSDMGPATIENATIKMRDAGLLDGDETADMAVRFLQLMGESSIIVETNRWGRWIVDLEYAGVGAIVRAKAERQCAATGVFSDVMLSEAAADKKKQISPRAAQGFVADFERLDVCVGSGTSTTGDRSTTWFIGDDVENSSLVSRALRFSALAKEPCHVSALLAFGLRKLPAIPIPVILVVLNRVGIVVNEAGYIQPGHAQSVGIEKPTILDRMVNILRIRGGKSALSDFIRDCCGQGINHVTVRAYCSRSGIFHREGPLIILGPDKRST